MEQLSNTVKSKKLNIDFLWSFCFAHYHYRGMNMKYLEDKNRMIQEYGLNVGSQESYKYKTIEDKVTTNDYDAGMAKAGDVSTNDGSVNDISTNDGPVNNITDDEIYGGGISYKSNTKQKLSKNINVGVSNHELKIEISEEGSQPSLKV